jgi:hypothetical protein
MNKLLIISCFNVALVLFFFSCGGSANNDLEKEKLELERQKLELEKQKLNTNKNKSNEQLNDVTDDSQNQSSVKSEYKFILGKWKGELRDKKFSIIIDNIDGTSVSGYNVTGSNKRPVKGKIYNTNDTEGADIGRLLGQYSPERAYKVILSEPGDDKWDGVFTIFFEYYNNEDGKGYHGSGSWKSNNGKLRGDLMVSKQ